jgi:hypothetical protein
MKTPRVKDFDPDAKVPTLKSSMDNMPLIGKPKKVLSLTTSDNNQSDIPLSQPNQYTSQRPLTNVEQMEVKPQGSQGSREVIAPYSSTASSGKRAFIKRTFDIFEDQLGYLTKESLQDRLAGKEGSMNAMIREAIDDWIKKRKARK